MPYDITFRVDEWFDLQSEEEELAVIESNAIDYLDCALMEQAETDPAIIQERIEQLKAIHALP